MSLSRSLPALVLLVLVGCQTPGPPPPLWGRLEAGPHAVGLRQITVIDTTRSDTLQAPRPDGRPIEVALWYPATPPQAQGRLTYNDYLHLLPQFRQATHPDSVAAWLATAISGAADGVGRDTLDRILYAPMQARPNLERAPGDFPLVLWTIRHETLAAQAILGEYLASHGYVVATARYAGPALPMPWAMETEEERLATFATHLEDLRFALASLEHVPGIDASRAALLTWSYAAELAPHIQMEHDNIRLVVGLSSNPLSPAGLYQGAGAAAHLDTTRLTVPYVVMTERIGFGGVERTAPAILPALSASSYFVRFEDLGHGTFNTLEGMIPGLFGIPRVQPWAIAGADAQLGHETIIQAVHAFLDQHLTPEGTPTPRDSTWEAALPPGFVTVTQYGGSG